MFSIILSILFSTSVLAAPTQFKSATVQWSSLKDDKSLGRFHSTLLNQTLLPFLNDCYSPNVTKKVQLPCTYYFDAVLQLNSTNFVVSQPKIVTLFNESSIDTQFCKRNHTYPTAKNFQTVPMNVSDAQTCGYMCIQENTAGELVPKPICAFLAWMGEQIEQQSKTAAPVLQPPAHAVGASAVKGTASHAVPANVAVSKELSAAAGKPEHPNEAPNTQSNIAAQTSTKNVETQSQTIPKPKQNSSEQKENAGVAAGLPAAASEAGVLPPIKVEKKPPVPTKEDQEDPPPTLSPDTQEEETLLPTNQGKHDSLPINQQANADQTNENDSDIDPNEDMNPEDTDDETGELLMRDDKLKPNEPPLASPDENEGYQKNSQEIIDRNDLPNINHVTDPFLEESGSNFFTYFLIGMFLCILLYVVYHNKSKILALLLEGRRSDKGRNGRRKHTAAYRKLDSNLEEAITSSASGRTTQIIY